MPAVRLIAGVCVVDLLIMSPTEIVYLARTRFMNLWHPFL